MPTTSIRHRVPDKPVHSIYRQREPCGNSLHWVHDPEIALVGSSVSMHGSSVDHCTVTFKGVALTHRLIAKRNYKLWIRFIKL